MRGRRDIAIWRLAVLGGAVLLCDRLDANAIAPHQAFIRASFAPALMPPQGGTLVLVLILMILQAVAIAALVRQNRRIRRTETAARQHLSELARLSRFAAMAELSTVMAHEIKQPLSAIATNASAGLRWLGRAPPDLGEVRAALERILAGAHRADDVVGGIRAPFKQAAESEVLLDINALIRDVLALLRGDLEKRKIAVVTALAPGLPGITGRAAQLQQVVLNVITNAAEAMESATDRPRVLRVASSRGGEGVVIAVEDSGVGVDPQNLGRIFEPLFTTKPRAIGVGLSICRSVVEAHGGSVSASPGDPHGLALRISLPAVAPGGAS
jgi:signal transduction histidine kinase